MFSLTQINPLFENVSGSIDSNSITDIKFLLLHKLFMGILLKENFECFVAMMNFKKTKIGQASMRMLNVNQHEFI